MVAAPFIALVLWPSLANYLGEEPVDVSCFDTGKINKNSTLVSLTLLTGALVVTLLVGGFLLEEGLLFILSLSVCLLIVSAVALFIRSKIAKPLVFWFILGVSTLNIDGAL